MTVRGETRIGETEHMVFFNNRAVVELEQQIGKPVLSLLKSLDSGEVMFADVAAMLVVGINAHRRSSGGKFTKITLPQVYDLMDEVGFAVALAAVVESLSNVFAPVDDTGESESPNAR